MVLLWLTYLAFLFGVVAVDTFSLQELLSPGARIEGNVTQPLRWSEYKAPQPRSIIHPASEKDVQTIVKWAIKRDIPFLVQNGGNGWATTFTLDGDGILIYLDQLRSVSFNRAGNEVNIGGGALISDVVSAAAIQRSLVLTGTCNCVGALGAMLGGGFSNLMGQYGMAVDDFLSFNMVKPDGQAVTVTAKNGQDDLWWAMRGAGPNFGIVTSAVLRAHPVRNKIELTAWTGPLIFRPDQLEVVIKAIRSLSRVPKMAVSLNFINQPSSGPVILATVFYHGDEQTGRAVFKPLFDINPVSSLAAVTPYKAWNDGSDIPCIKGGRRPTWGVGLASLDPTAWRKVYNLWAELIMIPGAEKSSVLLNVLPTEKACSLPDSSSAYPFRRNIIFHAGFTASYNDSAFDDVAVSYGNRARKIWQATDGLQQHSTYINNALGDESLETVYGASLERLVKLKKKIDPYRRFNEWFPLF